MNECGRGFGAPKAVRPINWDFKACFLKIDSKRRRTALSRSIGEHAVISYKEEIRRQTLPNIGRYCQVQIVQFSD